MSCSNIRLNLYRAFTPAPALLLPEDAPCDSLFSFSPGRPSTQLGINPTLTTYYSLKQHLEKPKFAAAAVAAIKIREVKRLCISTVNHSEANRLVAAAVEGVCAANCPFFHRDEKWIVGETSGFKWALMGDAPIEFHAETPLFVVYLHISL